MKDEQLSILCQTELYDYLSRSEADRRNFDKAIDFSSKLLSLNTKNKRAEEVLSYCIPVKLSLMPVNEKTVKKLESYMAEYNFLSGDKRIETLKAMLYGQIAQNYFMNRNAEKGLVYLKHFEGVMDNQRENVQVIPKAISSLYLIVGRYYYGNSKFKLAYRHFFQKGLSTTLRIKN